MIDEDLITSALNLVQDFQIGNNMGLAINAVDLLPDVSLASLASEIHGGGVSLVAESVQHLTDMGLTYNAAKLLPDISPAALASEIYSIEAALAPESVNKFADMGLTFDAVDLLPDISPVALASEICDTGAGLAPESVNKFADIGLTFDAVDLLPDISPVILANKIYGTEVSLVSETAQQLADGMFNAVAHGLLNTALHDCSYLESVIGKLHANDLTGGMQQELELYNQYVGEIQEYREKLQHEFQLGHALVEQITTASQMGDWYFGIKNTTDALALALDDALNMDWPSALGVGCSEILQLLLGAVNKFQKTIDKIWELFLYCRYRNRRYHLLKQINKTTSTISRLARKSRWAVLSGDGSGMRIKNGSELDYIARQSGKQGHIEAAPVTFESRNKYLSLSWAV